MLRKLIVPVLALAAVPSIASAQFEAGDLEFTLAGTGSMTRDVDGGAYGLQAGLGYFMTKELEVGIRQNVIFLEAEGSTPGVDNNGWGGRTTAFAAFHFDFGAFQPYVGGFGGYDYPEFAAGSGIVGPEVGLKYFVNGTTFLYGNLAYVYSLTNPGPESFFQSNIGVGFRF